VRHQRRLLPERRGEREGGAARRARTAASSSTARQHERRQDGAGQEAVVCDDAKRDLSRARPHRQVPGADASVEASIASALADRLRTARLSRGQHRPARLASAPGRRYACRGSCPRSKACSRRSCSSAIRVGWHRRANWAPHPP
jgi:hypothetical protein